MLRLLLPKPDDAYKPGARPATFRARRFALFERLVRDLPRPLRIIDIGGTTEFWEKHGWAGLDDIQITLVNLQAEPTRFPNIHSVKGDATNLADFADASFDVAFSNSVIEHLFTFENQQRMAHEVCRVGRAYWVQTPNYWFPVEPHFQMIGWQWLPVSWRVAILRRRTCGWRGKTADPIRARTLVEEVRLLSLRDLHQIFPDGTIVPEKFLGFVKSWIAIAGLPLLRNAGH